LNDKEVGRLTITTFNKLYKHYKNDFDLEIQLKQHNITYEELYKKSLEAEEWF
jgi:hypothetical protein